MAVITFFLHEYNVLTQSLPLKLRSFKKRYCHHKTLIKSLFMKPPSMWGKKVCFPIRRVPIFFYLNFAHVTSWFHSTCNIYSVTPNVILRFLSSHNSGHNTSLKTLIEILLSKYILTKKNLLGLIRLEVETSENCLDWYFLIVSLVGWQSLPIFHNNDAHEMSEMYAKSKIWFDFHLLFRFFLTSFSRNNASFCITMNDSFDERAKLLLLQLFSHCFRFLCVWNSEYKPHFVGERKVIIWCFSLIRSFIKYWNLSDAKSFRLAMLHQM